MVKNELTFDRESGILSISTAEDRSILKKI